jgi:hypothetical protein
MKTENIKNKLQHGYDSMFETIETSIKKEGKSLKQALDIADDKLKTVKDLSVDEYQHIRDEVRHDLHSLGEKLSDAKTSFTLRLQMDTIFMKNSAAKILSSIADQTAQELLLIKDSLLDKGNNIEKDKLYTTHREHGEWHDDHAFWLKEIEMWKKEHHEAGAKLLAIHDAIRHGGLELQEHAQAIRAHEVSDHDHEAILAKLEKQAENMLSPEESEKDIAAHEAMKKMHNNHARLHQYFKNKHRETMKLVERLNQLLTQQD